MLRTFSGNAEGVISLDTFEALSFEVRRLVVEKVLNRARQR